MYASAYLLSVFLAFIHETGRCCVLYSSLGDVMSESPWATLGGGRRPALFLAHLRNSSCAALLGVASALYETEMRKDC